MEITQRPGENILYRIEAEMQLFGGVFENYVIFCSSYELEIFYKQQRCLQIQSQRFSCKLLLNPMKSCSHHLLCSHSFCVLCKPFTEPFTFFPPTEQKPVNKRLYSGYSHSLQRGKKLYFVSNENCQGNIVNLSHTFRYNSLFTITILFIKF